MEKELLSQSDKMFQIREHTDSIEIMFNDEPYVTIFSNPCRRITDKAISVCLPFSEQILWIPKSIIILIDRVDNCRGGLSYQVILPEWFLRQNNIK